MVMDMFKVACIGECMIEMAPVASNTYKRGFAGDTFNTAVYFKRQFSDKLQVSYISALGQDSLSDATCEKMELEGVDTQLILRVEGGQPGLYLIENDSHGERFFSYWRSVSAARTMFKGMDENAIYDLLKPFQLIYLSGISLAILDAAQRCCLLKALAKLQNRTVIAFDPNYRSALWRDIEECIGVFKKMARISSIVLSTFDDDKAIWGDVSIDTAGQRWRDWGVKEVVIKNGPEGCHVYAEEISSHVPAPETIKPLDTTGAGDSFCAGYLGARLLGNTEMQAALLAHKIAGQVIRHSGGVITQENWHPVTELHSSFQY